MTATALAMPERVQRRSRKELAAAVLGAAGGEPRTMRQIQEAIRAGDAAPPNIDGTIQTLIAAGKLREVGARHTLERGKEALYVRTMYGSPKTCK